MKDEQLKAIHDILIDLQGQVLGLKAVMTSILVANPNIKIEEHQISRSIILTKGLAVDDPLVTKKAREIMQELAGQTGR